MSRRRVSRVHSLMAWFACAALATPASATWSIIIIDTATREIAIGSATCLLNFDLLRGLPAVRVDVGAAAAQSAIDGGAVNRQRIVAGWQAGLSPQQILDDLAAHDGGHQSRQYGIVDVYGRAVTFTGSQDGPFANGLTGQFGSLVYSIQGNVITGQPVLDQAEAAIRNTAGGLPEKLMAAMEAARLMGGDGRCSCSAGNPPGCGSPPPNFTKSAHIGFMVVTRRGDADGTCSSAGCANGTYYLKFNVANQQASAPDPVIQLRTQFDDWRMQLNNVPDQVESTATISPATVLDDGEHTLTLRVEMRDWRRMPVNAPPGFLVEHDPRGSANISTIGEPQYLGGGVFEVPIVSGSRAGVDSFAVSWVHAVQTRYLLPSPVLHIQEAIADLNSDGVVNLADLSLLLSSFAMDDRGDLDHDGETGLSDLARLLANL